MKTILAFAGSNSSTSINHQLVLYAAAKLLKHQAKVIRLTDYPLPLFGEDLEKIEGYPKLLHALLQEIKTADALMVSVNEHNGTVFAFFKNTLDWLSRIEYKFLQGKKVFLMSTSDGKRGALSALEYVEGVLPRFGCDTVFTFRLPMFTTNFKEGKLIDVALQQEIEQEIWEFENSI